MALSELSPGTAAGWIRIWASVDHCSDFDALWGGIFCCLSGANSFEDAAVDGSAADGSSGDKLAWGKHIPLFMTRLTASLELPVLGGSPPRNKLPSICEIVSPFTNASSGGRSRCVQQYLLSNPSSQCIESGAAATRLPSPSPIAPPPFSLHTSCLALESPVP